MSARILAAFDVQQNDEVLRVSQRHDGTMMLLTLPRAVRLQR